MAQHQLVLTQHKWISRIGGLLQTIKLRRLAALTGALLASVLIWWAWEPLAELLALLSDQAAVQAFVASCGIWGPLVLALIQLVQVVVAVVPGHFLMVVAGYAYGFLPGLLLNLVSVVVASQLAFGLARWAGRPLVTRLVAPHVLERLDRLAQRQGPVFFAICFAIPFFPGDILNLVAGLSPISSPRFLAASILGRLPIVALLTMAGSNGLQLPPGVWAVLICALAIAVLVWACRSRGIRFRLPLGIPQPLHT